MVSQGVFGYIIGRKKRMMHVNIDADMFWQILVREIYVLMKHYETKEALKSAFEMIKITKNKPKLEDIEKCKIFADLEVLNNKADDWYCLLRYCQHSFINILEAGYIINQKEEYGLVFMLDFNKGLVSCYSNNSKILETATIEEIMEFDEMPTKCYKEIIKEMREIFGIWNEKFLKISEELVNLKKIKQESKNQGAVNIEYKVDKLIYDVKLQRQILYGERRVFYNRLEALDLIENDL
jgi:hypothetical protein